jgi:hypothetical protein
MWFSPDTPVSSTNKTDRHDITAILLKVAFNARKPNQTMLHILQKNVHSRIKLRQLPDSLNKLLFGFVFQWDRDSYFEF